MSGGGERVEIARQSYRAFAAGDRAFFDEHLSDDFTLSSPPDPQLDRDGWFERRGLLRVDPDLIRPTRLWSRRP